MPFKIQAVAAIAILAHNALGGNPLVPNVGQADPHVHFWAETGTYYAYATHDFSPNNTGFKMDDWSVWSSPDLVSWELADTLYPNATPAPPGDYGKMLILCALL